MCLFVYLVTDSTLPELAWDRGQPAFNVQRLARTEQFLSGLSGTNAYVLGSHEGCGCGFMSNDFDDPEERAASDASRQALSQFVEAVTRSDGKLFLLAAWDGDENKRAVHFKVTSKDLLVYPWDETSEAPHLIEVLPAPSNASPRL